jgi:hypothetical protein
VPAAQAAVNPIRTYDLRLSIQMKSNFSFATKTIECGGPKQDGYSGAGEEIMKLSSPKPVRVTLMANRTQSGLMRKDLKPDLEVTGTTKRSGSMSWTVCGKPVATQFNDCLGEHRVDSAVNFQFLTGNRWVLGDSLKQSTREVVKACDDGVGFDWDGAVSRAGTTLISSHIGKAPWSKVAKTKGPFSLTASGRDECDADYFGVGTCVTEWSYKATFTPVKKKRRR